MESFWSLNFYVGFSLSNLALCYTLYLISHNEAGWVALDKFLLMISLFRLFDKFIDRYDFNCLSSKTMTS